MAGQGKNNTSVRANGDKKSCKHYVTKIIVWSSPHTPFSALLKRANFTSRKDRNKKSAENSNLDGLKFKILSFPPSYIAKDLFFILSSNVTNGTRRKLLSLEWYVSGYQFDPSIVVAVTILARDKVLFAAISEKQIITIYRLGKCNCLSSATFHWISLLYNVHFVQRGVVWKRCFTLTISS